MTSSQGWNRKLKQGTIKSYRILKFKMTDWDLQWTMRGEGINTIQAHLPCNLEAGSPCTGLGSGLTVLPCLWLAAWELPEKPAGRAWRAGACFSLSRLPREAAASLPGPGRVSSCS